MAGRMYIKNKNIKPIGISEEDFIILSLLGEKTKISLKRLLSVIDVFPEVVLYVENVSKTALYKAIIKKPSLFKRIRKRGLLKLDTESAIYELAYETCGVVFSYLTKKDILLLTEKSIRNILYNWPLYTVKLFVKRLDVFNIEDPRVELFIHSSAGSLVDKKYLLYKKYRSEIKFVPDVFGKLTEEDMSYEEMYSIMIEMINKTRDNPYKYSRAYPANILESILKNKNLKFPEKYLIATLNALEENLNSIIELTIPRRYETEDVALWEIRNYCSASLSFYIYTLTDKTAMALMNNKRISKNLIRKIIKYNSASAKKLSDATKLLLTLNYGVEI